MTSSYKLNDTSYLPQPLPGVWQVCRHDNHDDGWVSSYRANGWREHDANIDVGITARLSLSDNSGTECDI